MRDELSPQELARMRDGEVRWGEQQERHIDIPAAGVATSILGDFRHVIRIQDVARLWGVRVSMHTDQSVAAGDALLCRVTIRSGVGSARFTQALVLSITGPFAAVPPGIEVTQFVPNYPAETIDVEMAFDVAAGAGAARSYKVNLNAAAAPYNRGRADS